MSQINPFSGYLAGASHVQRQQAAEKDRLLRRAHELTKNIALQGDQLEHQVESSEQISPVREHRDEDPTNQRRKDTPPRSEAEPPRLDLRA
jgi:hypothetical protein